VLKTFPARASSPHRVTLAFALILILACVLRAGFILWVDPQPRLAGGDVNWYLQTGLRLIQNSQNDPVQTGPVFLLYAGAAQLLSGENAVLILRLLNILWHAFLISALAAIAHYFWGTGVALITALLLAISPSFIIEAGTPLTESLFMAIMAGSLYLTICRQQRFFTFALVGLLLGLAALTRVVALAFPLVIIIYLIRAQGWRRGFRLAGVMVIIFVLTVGSWSAYNLARWNRFIIGGEGLTAFAYMGAANITDTTKVDASIGANAGQNRDSAFVGGVLDRLRNDFPGWLGGRLSNLADAYLQPHNTVYFPGESLKALAEQWWREDRSFTGLGRLVAGDFFWPKLILYIFHFGTLLLGTLAMLWYARRFFWRALPLYGWVAYLTAIHLIILALPRYMFPIMPIFYVFTGVAIAGLFTRQPKRNILVGRSQAL
jgi:4-amino-4-deoxy-L-arabinose transferase-like glycosyltransferase